MIKKIIHYFAHKFGINRGDIVMWWEGGYLMIGFKCSTCGEIESIYNTKIRR